MIPNVAYVRFVVHGGNMREDNELQIRLSSRQAAFGQRPALFDSSHRRSGGRNCFACYTAAQCSEFNGRQHQRPDS